MKAMDSFGFLKELFVYLILLVIFAGIIDLFKGAIVAKYQRSREQRKQQKQAEAEARGRRKEEAEADARKKQQERSREAWRDPLAGSMTQEQALEILELKAGAAAPEIRASYNRLMQKVHPDAGGSTYFAKQLNLARDALLKG